MREKRAKMSFEKGERQNETKTNLCGYQFNHLSLSLSLCDACATCYCSLFLSLSLSTLPRARVSGVVVYFVLFVFHT